MTTGYSASVPVPLLGPLVAAGMWSPERALRAARARSDNGARAHALTALAPHLDGEHRRRALHHAVDAALAVEDEDERAEALAALAPHLEADQHARVLAAARSHHDPAHRAWLLAALLPRLDGDRRARAGADALESALSLTDAWRRAWTLARLLPHLDGDRRRRAAATALDSIDSVGNLNRIAALTALAPHLDADQRRRALAQAVADARAVTGDGDRARALVDLAPHLDEAALLEAMRLVWTIDDAEFRAWALAALLPRLDAESRRRVLTRAVRPLECCDGTGPRRDRRTTHAAICDHYLAYFGGLDRGLPRLAADPGLGGVHGGYPLRHLAFHLEQAGRGADLDRLLTVYLPGSPTGEGVWVAAHDHHGCLCHYRDALDRALRRAERETDAAAERGFLAPSLGREVRYTTARKRLPAADNLVPAPPPGLWTAAAAWHPEWVRPAARPDHDRLARALDRVFAAEPPDTERLAELAPRLDGELLARAVSRAVAIGRDTEGAGSELLAELAPTPDSGFLVTALELAQAVDDLGGLVRDWGRVRALIVLAPYLDRPVGPLDGDVVRLVRLVREHLER